MTLDQSDPPARPTTAIILVALSHDGTDVWQTTTGRHVRGNLYEILATPDYDAELADWEFPPGTLVECTPSSRRDGTPFLVAVRAVNKYRRLRNSDGLLARFVHQDCALCDETTIEPVMIAGSRPVDRTAAAVPERGQSAEVEARG